MANNLPLSTPIYPLNRNQLSVSSQGLSWSLMDGEGGGDVNEPQNLEVSSLAGTDSLTFKLK